MEQRLHLTPDLLRRYAAGALTPAEQHAVERLLLDDPLAAEAAEGLAQLREAGVDGKTANADLRARLQKRVAKRQGRVVPLVWTRYAAAATVLLAVAGLGWWWLRTEPTTTESAVVASRPASEAAQPQPAVKPMPALAAPPEAAQTKPSPPPPKAAPQRFSVPQPAVRADEAAPAATAPTGTDATKGETPPNDVAGQSDQAARKRTAPAAASAPQAAAPASTRRALTGPRFTGQVLGENRQPVAGASVQVLGTNRGTTTDDEGRFVLSGLLTGNRLRVAMVGYQRAEVIVRDTTALTVTLQPDATALREVVVTGYGTQEKRALTGAVSALRTAPEGGFAVLEAHVRNNRRVAGQGTVTLSFRIAANGQPRQIRVQASDNPALNAEARRLLKTGPRWTVNKTTKRAGRVVYEMRFE